MFIGTYNITSLKWGSATYATDSNGNTLNDYQITISADFAIFIDVSTELRIESETIVIGDYVAQYSLETNQEITDVTIYMSLNGTYIQFPDGTYTATPGIIVFSRPTYGYYNFTRYFEFNGANTTRMTWITITSNAELVNSIVSGVDVDSDYITIAWNTNKGTGILRVYTNGSLTTTASTEGITRFQKSTTVGLHQLVFNVTVETRVFTFYAEYTIPPWTAIITLSADDRVSIQDTVPVLITVLRSDEQTFYGTVLINGETINILAGIGYYYAYSYSVDTITVSVTNCYDAGHNERDLVTSDISIKFDKLQISLSKSTDTPLVDFMMEIYCNITRLNDGTIPTVFEYKVYVNGIYRQTIINDNSFEFMATSSGTYMIELKYVNDRGEGIDEFIASGISFIVRDRKVGIGAQYGDAILLGVIILVSVFVIRGLYNRFWPETVNYVLVQK